jgi:mevalonate kinase
MIATAQAFAKVIITGEHSVVYGHPALATVTSLNTTVTVADSKTDVISEPLIANVLEVFYTSFANFSSERACVSEIKSTIPIGCGFGSSAAVASALFGALAKFHNVSLSKEELINLVQESEKFAHGKPSGIDATTIVMNTPLVFCKNRETSSLKFDVLDNDVLQKIPFVFINSGTPAESTKEMVEFVSGQILKNPTHTNELLEKIGAVTQMVIDDIHRGQFHPQHLSINQKLLEDLGVVGKRAKLIIEKIESIGGYAKITGAGGRKEGSGMILAYHSSKEKLIDLARSNQWEFYQ